MKRIRTGLFASATAIAVALGASAFDSARAQSASDINARLDRLQRDMDTLQRSVYHGRPPPPSSGYGGGLPADARYQADMSVRIDQLESRLAAATGRTEEIEHQMRLMRERLDQIAADLESRRGAAAAPAGAAAPAQPQSRPQSAAAQPGPPPVVGGEGAGPGAPPRSLGTIPSDAVPPGPPPDAPPPERAPRAGGASGASAASDGTQLATLPPGTPKQQYDYATSLLMNKQDYAAAETALKAFVAAHPKDALAGSAQYWVGETHFARKDYQNAAFAYAEGVEKYPQSAKAPDSLLKLGMSLARLGKNDQACTALSRLQTAFPNANDQVKKRAVEERTRIKCKA